MIFNAKSVFLAVNASFMHYRTDPSPHHHLLSDKLKTVHLFILLSLDLQDSTWGGGANQW